MRDHAAVQKVLTVMSLRNLILDYRQKRDTEMAHVVLRMEPASSNLQLSPPGRRSILCPLMEIHSEPPEQRGAKRASKKPKGSRSQGRR